MAKKMKKSVTAQPASPVDKMAHFRKIPFFFNADIQDLKKLAEISVLKEHRKGTLIIKEGAEGDALYIIVKGYVKICRTATGNKSKTLAILEKNDYFGEMALIDRDLRSASCVAMTDVVTLSVSRKDFENMLKANSKLAFVIFKTFSARLREADKQIEILSFQNVLGRLAITLLDISAKYGKKVSEGILITRDFTHQDLADMVGTAREMVSRILNNFKENGCISYKKNKLYITNRRKLMKWIY